MAGEQSGQDVPDVSQLHDNPLGQSTVTVAVPKNIRVQMVDASALSQFQVAGLFTSLLSSASVSFFVAYLQASKPRPTHLLVEAIVWTLLFVVALIWTLATRRRLTPESTEIPYGMVRPLPADQQQTAG
jgi:hypothetical protein